MAIRVLALALLFGLPSPSRADEADDSIARAHYQAGMACYRAEQYRLAAKEFGEAYRLSRRPDFLYNMGLTHEQLDDPGRASTYYRRYFAARPDAPERQEIEAKLFRMSHRVATLEVRGPVPGTEIRIDGDVVGLTPLDAQVLTEGHHHLAARQPDGLSLETDLDLRGGRSSEVALDKLATAPPSPPHPPVHTGGAAADKPMTELTAREIARAFFATGRVYFKHQRFRNAVDEFLAGFRLSKLPEFQYNIARCYERLDDPGRAVFHYREYVRVRPDAPEKQEVSARLAALMARVATLEVKSETPGVEIALDGERVGVTPLAALTLTAGHHAIEASRPGHIAARTEIDLAPGQRRELSLEPQEVPRPVVVAVPPPVVAPSEPKKRPRWLVPVLAAAGAAVVAGALIGIVLSVISRDYAAETRAKCPAGSDGCLLFGAAVAF